MRNSLNQVFTELVLSPEGHVYLSESEYAQEQLPLIEFEKIKKSFEKGSSLGLLFLAVQDFSFALPNSFLFWQSFSRQFITKVCKLTQAAENNSLPHIPSPEKNELQLIINHGFLIKGFEYLNPDILAEIWVNLEEALKQELNDFSGNVQDYLKHHNPRWNLVGRVCFHLAENKNNEEKPFAFLATYTTQLSQKATPQHLPLKRALQDYAGEKNHAALLALLQPIQKAANQSNFIKNLVDTGSVFKPQTWTIHEAYSFLKEIPLMEDGGIMVRVPNWWNSQKPARPKVMIKIGENQHNVLGLNALLDFNFHVALEDGEQLSEEELLALQNAQDGLIKIKGQWVEINREKLKNVLAHWSKLQQAAKNGLSMAEGLRLLAGGGSDIFSNESLEATETATEWSTVVAGDWLKNVLENLNNPNPSKAKYVEKILKNNLQATLRPYQMKGVEWLWLLYQLKLGGCLADDMGLGKTIQVISLMLLAKNHDDNSQQTRKPHLLIVPASLLGNWQAEIIRFSPKLKFLIAHPSSTNKEKITNVSTQQLNGVDLVITTYAFVNRLEWLKEIEWDLIILDEAQQIKNPGTKQTLAVKSLKSQVRITLTGTPIENRLSDLWSLFDFTSQGLLGTNKTFSDYAKKAGKDSSQPQYLHFISTLRRLTQPYILRRLKSDKKIINDLPDKTEMQTFCSLSKQQVQLYQNAIEELSRKLEKSEGIQRQGLILSSLILFKQICNHPAQCLGYGEYFHEESGKFVRLKELCEEIALKQEKVLVFTQFKEIIPAISNFLTKVFGREGLTLHGETPVKKRGELVKSFQEEQGPPFFVLSLKAGGTGLNLTRASHVIHFDRWWNPAVENQATDRAYRIGQKHPVMVHKFVCMGTIEEKIEELINSKNNMAKGILECDSEVSISTLSNKELIDLVSLDIQRAMGDF